MKKRLISCMVSLALLLHAGGVFALAQTPDSSAMQDALAFLSETPADTWRTLCLSVSGQLLSNDAACEQGLLRAQEHIAGSGSGEELALAIIDLSKLDENPTAYKRLNLLSELYTRSGLLKEGVDVAALALAAYQCVDVSVPVNAKNSEAALMDFIVSSQQISGGFSSVPGKDATVYTTSLVSLSLSAYRDRPYVAAALERAVTWLSLQQKSDGSFGSGLDTAAAVAALAACGVSPDDIRFVKSEATILDGLMLFCCEDGGFSNEAGQQANAVVTEWAVIALATSETGLSPFLPADQYAGYVSRPKPLMQSFSTAGYIMLGGAVLLVGLILFFILWERRRILLRARQAIADTSTLEMNIQMKAELPDFGSISEKESSPFRTLDMRALRKKPRPESAEPAAENTAPKEPGSSSEAAPEDA